MTTATMNKSELMAPPVAETIQTRSMFIGLVGTVAAVAAGWRQSASAPEMISISSLVIMA